MDYYGGFSLIESVVKSICPLLTYIFVLIVHHILLHCIGARMLLYPDILRHRHSCMHSKYSVTTKYPAIALTQH